jgi:hypothetical protein
VSHISLFIDASEESERLVIETASFFFNLISGSEAVASLIRSMTIGPEFLIRATDVDDVDTQFKVRGRSMRIAGSTASDRLVSPRISGRLQVIVVLGALDRLAITTPKERATVKTPWEALEVDTCSSVSWRSIDKDAAGLDDVDTIFVEISTPWTVRAGDEQDDVLVRLVDSGMAAAILATLTDVVEVIPQAISLFRLKTAFDAVDWDRILTAKILSMVISMSDATDAETILTTGRTDLNKTPLLVDDNDVIVVERGLSTAIPATDEDDSEVRLVETDLLKVRASGSVVLVDVSRTLIFLSINSGGVVVVEVDVRLSSNPTVFPVTSNGTSGAVDWLTRSIDR